MGREIRFLKIYWRHNDFNVILFNMRLICLNLWGGRRYEALKGFLEKMSAETDIFCFQEVFQSEKVFLEGKEGRRLDLIERLAEILPAFDYCYAPTHTANNKSAGAGSGVTIGNAIFYRKDLRLTESGAFFAAGSLGEAGSIGTDEVGLLQYAVFKTESGAFTVGNFHGIGLWPKNDTPARLEQAKKVEKFFSARNGSKLLCGDFNLKPETESIAISGRGMKNLINDFGVKLTRSKISLEKFKDQPEKDTVSDYAFVSPDIQVNSFAVPDIEVSDHLPLVINFSLGQHPNQVH